MKNAIIPLLTLVFLIVFILGCPPSPKSNVEPVTEPDEPVVEEITLPVSEDPGELFTEMALDYLLKLGFEREELLIADVDTIGEPLAGNWVINIDDLSGRLVIFNASEKKNCIEGIRFEKALDNDAPEPLRPGEDMSNRVATALGLEEKGYVLKVTSEKNIVDFPIFERLEPVAGYMVSTGEVLLITDPMTGYLVSINIMEYNLPSPPEINFTEDEAANLGREILGDSSLELTGSRLVLMPIDFSEPDNAIIFWELTLGNSPILIRADTGQPI